MRRGSRTGVAAVAVVLLSSAGAAVAARTGGPATSAGTTTSNGTTTTVVGSLPDAPRLTSAVSGSDGVALSWDAPSSDGGSPVTYYRVYRGTASGQESALTTANDTKYTDATTVKGTTYVYQVTAVNAVGEGARSNELAVVAAGPALPSLLQPYQAYPVGSWPEAVAVGDVTGDGRDDVVMTTSYYFDPADDYHLFVFAQNADRTLAPPVSYLTAAGYNSRPSSVAIGDITGDGRADVVVGIDTVGVQVFPQVAGGTLGSPTMTATANCQKIRLGRLNGDAKLDVAGVGWGTNTVDVLLNNGSGGLQPPVTYAAKHGGYDDLEVADVSGDARDDLVVMSGQTYAVPNISVLTQLAGGGFGPAAEYRLGTNVLTDGIGVGDVNGDGRKDVVASDGYDGTLAVFPQTSVGTLGPPIPHSTYNNPEPVEVGDLDVDGRADVVTLHGGWYAAGVYRQKTDGTLAPEDRYALPYASHYNPHGLAIGDVTGDGMPDVVVADYNHGLVVLRNSIPSPAATAPGAPTLTSATAGKAAVTLTWTAPSSDGGAAVSGYRIYRGTSPGGETFLRSVGAVTSFTDTSVAGGTTYYYDVAAVNGVGEGAPSNERSATPAPATAPDAPALSVAVAGYNNVTLRWSTPVSNGGASITGYNVYRGTAAGAEKLLVTVGNVNGFTDNDAVGGTTYYYEVTAVNAVGESAASNELSATPLTPSAPEAPTLTAATAGFSKVTVTWAPPAFNGGAAITGYNVYRTTASGAETVLATLGGVTSYTDTSGVLGTTYYYEVTAVNPIGESARSNERSATPIRAVFQPYQATWVGSWPEAVAVGDVTGDGRNDVVLTTSYYFDPANDYHLFVFAQRSDGTLAPPVSYLTTATYDNPPQSVAVGDITGDGRSDVVVGLRGLGVQVFPQLSSGALGPPTLTASPDVGVIRLGQLDGDGRLDVASVGGSVGVFLNDGRGGLRPPAAYAVQGSDLEVADVTNDGRDDVAVLSGQNVTVLPQVGAGGFGPATVYPTAANARGTNGIGVGDLNNDGRTDVVVSYGGNSPNSFVTVLAQGADGTLAAPVAYSSYDIPEPIDAADLDLDGRADMVTLHGGWNAAGVYRQQANGTPGAEELYGIPYASQYDQHGLAVGDVNGDGSPDVVLADYNNGLVVLRNTTAPANVPRVPNLTAAVADSGGVSLTWAPPASTGGAASGYKIYRGTTAGGETLLATIGTACSYTDNTAVTGTTYFYDVSAVNSLGEGPRSNERSATRASVPGAPTLTSAAGGSASVSLVWSPPASNGGAAITGYRVYRRTSAGGESLLATVGSVTSYTDGTAVSGTYFYEVTAVNSVGESARSNELSTAPDATPPSKPASLKLVVAGTNQLALDWPASTDNVGVSGYRVYRNNALVTTVAETQFLDNGLAAGASYTYQVRALDAAGNASLPSSNLTAKTLAMATGTTGTLAGAVYNRSGAPLANAVVTVILAGGAKKTAKTNASGAWKIASLPPATYAPSVSLSGYRSQTLSMTVVAGKTTLAVAVLAPP